MSLFPKVKWAQDSKLIFLNISETDLKNVKFEIKNDQFIFSAEKENKKYFLELNLLYDVDIEDYTKKINDNSCNFILNKTKSDWWDFLVKEKKLPNLEIDWNKWKYENESDDELYDYNIPDNFEELLQK